MVHALARDAAAQAAAAKTHALATLHATATAFGATDAHHGFNAFLARMDTIIAAAADPVGAGLSRDAAAAAELAAYEKLERHFSA